MAHHLLLSGALLAALVATACQLKETGGAQSGVEAAPAARSNFYACEGCEAALERESSTLVWRTRIGTKDEPGEPLIIRGTVHQVDGKTPAEGVILYAHHTNAQGLYAGGAEGSEWSRRHGRLRAWVKTGADGRYEFETIKPGVYPERNAPAHVHLTILEPGRPPYWIDDIVFSGEFGVTPAYRSAQEGRGGSGIVILRKGDEGILIAERDIVLERHPASASMGHSPSGALLGAGTPPRVLRRP